MFEVGAREKRRKRREETAEEENRKGKRRHGKRAADSQSPITWTRRHAPPPFPATGGGKEGKDTREYAMRNTRYCAP